MKTQTLKSGFIENSNFENNRDPWSTHLYILRHKQTHMLRWRRRREECSQGWKLQSVTAWTSSNLSWLELKSHLTLMDFVEFFMVGPTALSLRFRNIEMILFRCFSSRLQQSTLVTWFWFHSPPSSAASVSLSSLSGLSFSFFSGLTSYPCIFPWFFPPLSGLKSQGQSHPFHRFKPAGEAEDWKRCDLECDHARGRRKRIRGREGGHIVMNWTGRWELSSHNPLLFQLDGVLTSVEK